ncbi:hypothetical protein Glove_291g52 [Diversispora epigaea]|uniref:Uncharacterized protein n=1 Tax=Diversispora epigaea TaxID=1348612 RepID=A0A397I5C3_9GLOM|nr:hypothetical protein Glove_291g52 [Diversispora epigaea]
MRFSDHNEAEPPTIKFSQASLCLLNDCIYDAGYLEKRHSNHNLEFMTEQSFLIVDCGGGTLTTCKFMLANSLGEDTERTYADKEFIKLLKRSAGMKQ